MFIKNNMEENKVEDKSVLGENKSVKTVHRKKTRRYLFQKLYAATFSWVNSASFDESFYNDVFDFDIDSVYLEEMFELILNKEAYLLEIIRILAPKFKVESMGMDYILPILIWACEMLYFSEEIPAKVSLNESVEMAKIYWDESSKKIVNWVMNKFYKQYDEIKKQLDEFDWKTDFVLFKK